MFIVPKIFKLFEKRWLLVSLNYEIVLQIVDEDSLVKGEKFIICKILKLYVERCGYNRKDKYTNIQTTLPNIDNRSVFLLFTNVQLQRDKKTAVKFNENVKHIGSIQNIA